MNEIVYIINYYVNIIFTKKSIKTKIVESSNYIKSKNRLRDLIKAL